ncbi:hypothetical protein ACFLZS_01630 [Patescibacteria group bacterium]
MSKPSFIHELKLIKQFSVLGRAILVIAGVVLLLGGGASGYLAARSTVDASPESQTDLTTKNYQLKFDDLEEKGIKGEKSEGMKLTYRGEEITDSEIELSPKEGSKKINLKLTLGNQILNLILPLFSPPEVVVATNTESTKSSGASTDTKTKTTGKYAASKSGGKYHLPDCRYAKKMKTKIWYGTKEEAEADGKDPCGVCKP